MAPMTRCGVDTRDIVRIVSSPSLLLRWHCARPTQIGTKQQEAIIRRQQEKKTAGEVEPTAPEQFALGVALYSTQRTTKRRWPEHDNVILYCE